MIPDANSKRRVLWIPPGGMAGGNLGSGLDDEAWEVEVCRDALEAVGRLRSAAYQALVASVPLLDWTPEELLEEALRANRQVSIIIHYPEAGIADAARLTRLGAVDVLGAEAGAAEVRAAVARAVEATAGGFPREPWRNLLVGESQGIQNVCEVIRLVGSRRCTVLVTGETGTGKELVARALHMSGVRAPYPMVAVNCGAIPEDLLEAELFGHVKGAFTGAIQNRVGRFEQANRGTLFLDEVGDMPMETQGKLLRVLQEREFQRLGSSDTVKVDVRVVAATNVDLLERVEDGRFREDLYYRLNVVPVLMPPMRERPRDIPLLVHHFLDKICKQEEIPLRRIAPEALDRLCLYRWPGNVRQLENAIEMAIALSDQRLTLFSGDFPLPAVTRARPDVAPSEARVSLPEGGLDYEQTVSGFERHILEQALRRTRGNKKAAADMLRLKRTTLSAKLRSLAMWPEERMSASAAVGLPFPAAWRG
ncbi:MAG: sigma-54 dependent transcriptional regulator [Bryobacteraceae bacterium]